MAACGANRWGVAPKRFARLVAHQGAGDGATCLFFRQDQPQAPRRQGSGAHRGSQFIHMQVRVRLLTC